MERQARAQRLRAVRGRRAEVPQPERVTVEADDERSVRVRFEGDVTGEPS